MKKNTILNYTVVYDGCCTMCSWSARFISKHQRNTSINLIASSTPKYSAYKPIAEKTIMLFEDDKLYLNSTAALRIVKLLKFPINILYIFIIIPKHWRDGAYRLISKSRYRLFGRKTCGNNSELA